MSTRLLRILAMATAMIMVTAGTPDRATAVASRTPTIAPAAAAPGVVSGQITGGDGPIAAVAAELVLLAFPLVVARAISDADGQFRLDPAPVGDYRLRFTFPGGLVQYYPHETDPERATIVNIIDGNQLVLDDTVVPHGSLAGSITTDAGDPAPAAIVGLVRPDGSQFSTVLANRDGSYLFAYLPAGTFRAFVGAAETAAPRQWAHRAQDPGRGRTGRRRHRPADQARRAAAPARDHHRPVHRGRRAGLGVRAFNDVVRRLHLRPRPQRRPVRYDRLRGTVHSGVPATVRIGPMGAR